MHAANSCNHNCIDITSASNAREELDELLQVNLSIAFACRLYFYRLDWHCNYLESNLLQIHRIYQIQRHLSRQPLHCPVPASIGHCWPTQATSIYSPPIPHSQRRYATIFGFVFLTWNLFFVILYVLNMLWYIPHWCIYSCPQTNRHKQSTMAGDICISNSNRKPYNVLKISTFCK